MVIQVKVKPNARVAKFEELADGTWIAHVKATPVDGKANEKLIAIVAEHFGVSKSDVSIQTGKSSRIKRLRIERF